MSNEYAKAINERDEARREAAQWQAAAEANLAEIKIDKDVLNRKMIELRELRAQLAEAEPKLRKADARIANANKTTEDWMARFQGKADALEKVEGQLAALSAVVLPEGARVFVKSGTDKGSYVTMIDGKPYIEWHPPKAESGEGDEYAKDPDAGTLASELCRIADSIGRNDCTRKWAEKFIYSIVDELPPAIASHVMRPPVESAPAPKAPAASEEPKPVQRGMNCACLSGEHEHCTCGYEWRVKLQTEQTMHAAWRKRAEEAEDERDEILERLKEIGDLVGCNHFNDPDGRLKLVNCVQDCLMSAESIAYVRRLTNQRNYSDPPVAKRPDGFPRRNDVSLYCPAEAAIKAAVDAVEATGADVLLTDAVVLLGLAKDKVADFVELPR